MNTCNNCGKEILPKADTKYARYEAKRKKFCSHSCAATFNNSKYPKKAALTHGPCEKCGCDIIYTKLKTGYSRKRFCDTCRPVILAEARKRKAEEKGHVVLIKPIEEYTKGELRTACPNYNYFGSKMAAHARSIYMQSDRAKECSICGYSYHVDVCHIKDISKFSDNELIGKINDLSNLVALCKNHHKEFDDGFITI